MYLTSKGDNTRCTGSQGNNASIPCWEPARYCCHTLLQLKPSSQSWVHSCSHLPKMCFRDLAPGIVETFPIFKRQKYNKQNKQHAHAGIWRNKIPVHKSGKVQELFSFPTGCFPGGSSGKEHACHCRRRKPISVGSWFILDRSHFIQNLGQVIPWRRAWQPTPVFLPGEFHGQRSLVGYSP